VSALFLAGCMEGTKPSASLAKRTLYERLGGEAVVKLVDNFTTAVVADPKVRPEVKEHFQGEAGAALKKKLLDRIGQATGGPQLHTGKGMKDVYLELQITGADFDLLVDDWKAAMNNNKIGKEEQEELLALLERSRKDVVEKAE
jgi:truncated hemoglobin YjbI